VKKIITKQSTADVSSVQMLSSAVTHIAMLGARENFPSWRAGLVDRITLHWARSLLGCVTVCKRCLF